MEVKAKGGVVMVVVTLAVSGTVSREGIVSRTVVYMYGINCRPRSPGGCVTKCHKHKTSFSTPHSNNICKVFVYATRCQHVCHYLWSLLFLAMYDVHNQSTKLNVVSICTCMVIQPFIVQKWDTFRWLLWVWLTLWSKRGMKSLHCRIVVFVCTYNTWKYLTQSSRARFIHIMNVLV